MFHVEHVGLENDGLGRDLYLEFYVFGNHDAGYLPEVGDDVVQI